MKRKMFTISLSGSSKIPKTKSATFGFKNKSVQLNKQGLETLVTYINTHAIIACNIKKQHRNRENIENISNFFRIDVDLEGMSDKVEKKLNKAKLFYIKKPSTNNDKSPYKWHYLIPFDNGFEGKTVMESYAGYKIQYELFLIKLGIKREWVDLALKSVVQNMNPYKNGKAVEDANSKTVINKGLVFQAEPKIVLPKPPAVKSKTNQKTKKSEIVKALNKIDVNTSSYMDWFTIGMALYDYCPKRGLKLFKRWSKDYNDYDEYEINDKWNSFVSGDIDGDVKIATLMHMAHGERKTQEEIDDDKTSSFKPEKSVGKLKKGQLVKAGTPPARKIPKDASGESIKYDKSGVSWDVLERVKKEVFRVRGGFEMYNYNDNWIFMTDKEVWDAITLNFGNPFDYSHKNKLDETEAKFARMLGKVTNHFDKSTSASGSGMVKVDAKSDKEGKHLQQQLSKLDELRELYEIEVKAVDAEYAKVRKKVLMHVKNVNQYEMRSVIVDPFAKSNSAVLQGTHLNLITNKMFSDKVVHKPKGDTQAVFKDFGKHFKQFVPFLDQIAYSRFAHDRKKSSIITKLPSDFGKSMLGDIFRELGILASVNAKEVKKGMNGEPSALNASEIEKAWILFFDESRFIGAEAKALDNNITFAQKGLQRTTLRVYTKWYATAEGIQNFNTTGVDGQFANRFTHIDVGDDRTINARKLFKEDPSFYVTALTYEIKKHFTKIIKKMLKLGKLEANKVASKKVSAFHSEYKLKGTLKDTIDEAFGTTMHEIIEVKKSSDFGGNKITKIDDVIRKSFTIHKGELYCTSVGKLSHILEVILKEHYGDDSKAILYKKS